MCTNLYTDPPVVPSLSRLASQPHSVPQRQSDRFQHPPADTDMYIYIDMEKVQMKDKTQKQKKRLKKTESVELIMSLTITYTH